MLSALEDEIRIPARPCNILYFFNIVDVSILSMKLWCCTSHSSLPIQYATERASIRMPHEQVFLRVLRFPLSSKTNIRLDLCSVIVNFGL